MGEELSYQITKYFNCQSSCLLSLLEVCKNHYKKENTVGGSEESRYALF